MKIYSPQIFFQKIFSDLELSHSKFNERKSENKIIYSVPAYKIKIWLQIKIKVERKYINLL